MPAPGADGGTSLSGDGGGGGCFIATAAFGSPIEGSVQILQKFRDAYLLTNGLGQWFVKTFYRYSSAVADVISKHEGLRLETRVALYPVIGLSWIILEASLFAKLLVVMVLFLAAAGIVISFKRLRAMA